MPLATPEQFRGMVDAARTHGYAYPAVNVTSSQTLNAALRGFADFGTSTKVIETTFFGADGVERKTATFVNEFWTARQRQAEARAQQVLAEAMYARAIAEARVRQAAAQLPPAKAP